MKRYTPYIVLGTLAVLAALAFWRRGSEQRMRRAVAERAAENLPERATPTAPEFPGRRLTFQPQSQKRAALVSDAGPPVEGEEILKEVPSWEGKQLRDYTVEEREETGFTNEKLFANAGAAHWSVLSSELKDKVDQAFVAEMEALSESYRDAMIPHAPDDPEENLEKERELLARLEKSVKPEELPEQARRSYEFLKKHVVMWENGEAEKLVDNKIERENDSAKRIALRARAQEPEADSPSDEDRRK
jgi:hypothetical protein